MLKIPLFTFKNFIILISLIIKSGLKYTFHILKNFLHLEGDDISSFSSTPHEELLRPKDFILSEEQDFSNSEIFIACSFIFTTIALTAIFIYLSLNPDCSYHTNLVDKVTHYGNYNFHHFFAEKLTEDQLKLILKILYRLQKNPKCSLNLKEQDLFRRFMEWLKHVMFFS